MSKIITAADLADYMQKDIAGETRAATIVNSINQWVENYTGRIWGEIKALKETFDYAPEVMLKTEDITEITSAKVYGEAKTDYKLNRDTGRLVLSDGRQNVYDRSAYDAIEVEYKAGNLEVPVDLKLATLQLATDNYNRRDGEGADVLSESAGTYKVTFGEVVTKSDLSGLPPDQQSRITDYMAIFNYYRLRGV